MVSTVIHVHSDFAGSLIPEYYRDCGLEPIGPYNDMTRSKILHFSTLQELLGNLRANSALNYHLVVCHGTKERGLLLKVMNDSSQNLTKEIADSLLGVTKQTEALTPAGKKWYDKKEFVQKYRNRLRLTSTAPILTLAELLSEVRRKKLVISIRGCNIGKNRPLMQSYKALFNAPRFMAPKCRDLFVRVDSGGRSNSRAYLGSPPAPTQVGRTWRRRTFSSPNPAVGPIVIDVVDHDGHSNVTASAYIQDRHDVTAWARILNGQYQKTQDAFVLEVMWEDSEASYHTPREAGYTNMLVVV